MDTVIVEAFSFNEEEARAAELAAPAAAAAALPTEVVRSKVGTGAVCVLTCMDG
jgi:hypothetical protein